MDMAERCGLVLVAKLSLVLTVMGVSGNDFFFNIQENELAFIYRKYDWYTGC